MRRSGSRPPASLVFSPLTVVCDPFARNRPSRGMSSALAAGLTTDSLMEGASPFPPGDGGMHYPLRSDWTSIGEAGWNEAKRQAECCATTSRLLWSVEANAYLNRRESEQAKRLRGLVQTDKARGQRLPHRLAITPTKPGGKCEPKAAKDELSERRNHRSGSHGWSNP